jgi:hypothetical protein
MRGRKPLCLTQDMVKVRTLQKLASEDGGPQLSSVADIFRRVFRSGY